MIKKLPIPSLAIVLMSLCVVAGMSATALTWTLQIRIFQLPQLDGGTTFEMEVGSLVHLPNGESNATNAHPSFVFDSFNEFKEAIIGEWTIETPMTPFQPHETYTFDVSDFPDSILEIVPPNIVSPTEGSTVLPTFTMTWAYPPGVTPQNSKATSIQKIGPGTRRGASASGHSPSNDLSEEMMAEYSSGGIPERVEIRAGSWHLNLLDEFVSEVTPHQDPSRFDYTIQTQLKNYSLPVQVFVGIPGDYNDNGLVDAADFAVWQKSKGQVGTDLAADGNHNGEIDLLDYDVWRAHFGESETSGSFADNAVPEPSAWVLVMVATTSLFSRRRL